MARKWTQEFVLNPFTNMRANDILAVARQGSPNTSGAGEVGVMSSRYTQIIVTNAGSDEYGNGSELSPLKTIQGAYDYIAGRGDASITKQYMICQKGAITETGPVTFLPFVHILTDGSPWYVSSITLDATFNAAVQVACYYQNLAFASNCTVDLLFTDGVGSGYGHLNFIAPRGIRVGATATPTIVFNVSSPDLRHSFNFHNQIMGEPNDGGQISIVCAASSAAPLAIMGSGPAPKVIDYSGCTNGGYIIINGAAADATSDTSITVNNTSLYIQNILSSYGVFSIEAMDNNTIYYDSSIGDPSTCISETGTGNNIVPITTSVAIRSTYNPVNFSYPSPLYFGNYASIFDAIKGIDNALGISNYSPGYINGAELTFTGLTTVQIGAVDCRDSTFSYNINNNSPVIIDISTNGAGGLDTGSAAANTKYALYVIAKSATGAASCVASTNFNTPDLSFDPDYDIYRYIGFIRTTTGAAQIVGFSCVGTGNQRTYYPASADTSLDVLSGGSATSFTNVDCSAWRNTTYIRAIGFEYTLNPGTETTNTAQLVSNSLGSPYWTRTPGVASITEIGSTGLMPINDNGSLIGYLFSSGTSTGRSLSLSINMVQEYI